MNFSFFLLFSIKTQFRRTFDEQIKQDAFFTVFEKRKIKFFKLKISKIKKKNIFKKISQKRPTKKNPKQKIKFLAIISSGRKFL